MCQNISVYVLNKVGTLLGVVQDKLCFKCEDVVSVLS